VASRITGEAQSHWDAGFTHYLLTIDAQQDTAHLIQWVESIGWKLEHAGWVWAQKGWIGYGGFTLPDSGVVGNFLFGRPGGPSSVRVPGDSTPPRIDG
jgi:hypothetical protein